MKNKLSNLILFLFILNVLFAISNIFLCITIKTKLDRIDENSTSIMETLSEWELDEY